METSYADKFRRHLENLGYSKTSSQMLPSCIAEFFSFTGTEAGEIQPADIVAYHSYIRSRPNKRKEGGLSPSYINHHMYAVRLFFSWQCESGQLKENPASSLAFPKSETPERELLTEEEIKRLYTLCYDVRERAFLSLFYGCGLRRSEAVKLNLKDIDFKRGVLYVKAGKGGKRREIPMGAKVAEDLKSYAENMRPLCKEKAFFPQPFQ